MLSAEHLDQLQEISPFRNRRLFSEFLPLGYQLTTLSSVTTRREVIDLKIILGTLITLYDDFADRPDSLNPRLLQILYRVPFERIEINQNFLSAHEKASLNLAETLFRKLMDGLERLPNFDRLFGLFSFDLKQFFLANSYSELLTQLPQLSNNLENRQYLHHNMGIVLAGMIDLMSLPQFDIAELGQSRSLFLLGQRAGRISNVLTTLAREQKENDVTNELLAPDSKADLIHEELRSLYLEMDRFQNIRSFSTVEYRKGIQSLHDLHLSLTGVI